MFFYVKNYYVSIIPAPYAFLKSVCSEQIPLTSLTVSEVS